MVDVSTAAGWNSVVRKTSAVETSRRGELSDEVSFGIRTLLVVG